MLRSLLLVPAAAALVACGPPIEQREDAAAVVAFGSVPAAHARPAQGTFRSPDGLPQPSVTLPGTHGGEATLDFNLVGAALGLVGEGLLFQVHYTDYSNDGVVFLSGDVAILANFDFEGSAEGIDAADLQLTLAGTVKVSGLYSDELYTRVTLSTRIDELTLREGELDLRLDGYIEGDFARFEFTDEDLITPWAQFAGR